MHGWSSSIALGWEQTGWIEALLPFRQVIALDVRGHGESDKPYVQAAYSYEAMAGDALALAALQMWP